MKTKNILNTYKNKKRKTNKNGMSLVEAIISITLLSLFFTIYTGFVEIASKFNQKGSTNLDNSNGLFIDHHYLALTLDEYKNVLSQPGILKSEINNIIQNKVGDLPTGCSLSPHSDWGIPVNQKPISDTNWKPSNAGYVICLKPTSIVESSLSNLVSKSKGNNNNAQPGLYFLVALPDELTINALPMRKLFCRPSPYC